MHQVKVGLLSVFRLPPCIGSLYYYWDEVEQCTMVVPIDQCPWVAPNSSSGSDYVASDYSDSDNSIFTTTPCTYVTHTGETVVLVPLIPPPGFVEEAKQTPAFSSEEWDTTDIQPCRFND